MELAAKTAYDASEAPRLLRVDVLRELRSDIYSCRIAPGTELREAELAARFGVSKSPVRDALSRLVHEGVVNVVPRQGYRVAPISLKDVEDMFDYRAVLETACARIGAVNANAGDLRALDTFRSFDEQVFGAFTDYNRAFHRSVAALSQSARLIGALAGQIDQMDRVVTMSVDATRKRDPERVVRQHGDIIDALQRRDGRKAASLLSRHVLEARKRVRDALRRMAVVE